MSKETVTDLQAYKIYVREKATISNLQVISFWNMGRHGNFELTKKKINDLIENALENNFWFNNESFKKGKDHGRGLSNNLSHPEKNCKVEMIEDFAQLFNLENFQEFTEGKNRGIYTDKIQEDQFQHADFDSCYIFYYWFDGSIWKVRNKGRIGKAKVEIKYTDENELSNCKITYYQFNEADDKWQKTANNINSDQDNQLADIKHSHNNVHVFIRSTHLTFMIMHSPDANFRNKRYLFCSYTTVDSGHLTSGIGLLKLTTHKDFELLLKPAATPPEIVNVLFQRRSFLRDREQTFVPDDFSDEFLFKTDFTNLPNEKKSKYVGVYKVYYLDSEFEGNNALRILLLQIDSSGEVFIEDTEAPMEGFCSMTSDGQILYITADFKFDIGGIPRFQIIINVPQENHSHLEGVYGGFSKKIKPYIGLIKLEKLESYTNISEALKAGHSPWNFTREKQQSNEFKLAVNESVIRFFYGDKFYNSPQKCLSGSLPQFKNLNYKEIYKGPTGFFFVYSTSSLKTGIVRYPLLIHENGSVEIKNSEKEIEYGRAITYYKNEYLLIDFNSDTPEDRRSKGTYLFYTNDKKNINSAGGVSIRINDNKQPQAKKEHLFRNNSPVKKGIDSLSPVDLFKASECFCIHYGTPLYEDLKDEYEKIDSLFGREYNLITTPAKINNKERLLQRESFDKIYLQEALLLFLEAKEVRNDLTYLNVDSNTKKELKKYLLLSIEHGIFEEQKLDVFITRFCKTVKINKIEVDSFFQPLFKECLKIHIDQRQ